MRWTVAELIEALEMCNPDAQVRLAEQPSWPFEYSVDRIEEVFTDDASPDFPDEGVVYIGEGNQLDYLPGEARAAMGW